MIKKKNVSLIPKSYWFRLNKPYIVKISIMYKIGVFLTFSMEAISFLFTFLLVYPLFFLFLVKR